MKFIKYLKFCQYIGRTDTGYPSFSPCRIDGLNVSVIDITLHVCHYLLVHLVEGHVYGKRVSQTQKYPCCWYCIPAFITGMAVVIVGGVKEWDMWGIDWGVFDCISVGNAACCIFPCCMLTC